MKLSSFSRGAGKYLLIGFFIYLIVFIIIMLIRGDILQNNEVTLALFSEWRKNESFLTSYFASSLDSLVFFTLIGGAAILLTVRDPSDEILFQKINYIFPQTRRDTHLAKYIQEEISSLACVVTDSKRSISIREISPCKKFLNIDIKGRSHIKNIFNNHDFVSDSMNFRTAVDPIDFQDVWGEVLDASIICDIRKPSDPRQSLNGTITLNKKTPTFTTSFPLNLAPNESVLYSTHVWFWQENIESTKFKVTRFTEKAVYEVSNELTHSLKLIIKSNKAQFSFSERIMEKIETLLKISNPTKGDEDELESLVSPIAVSNELSTKEYIIEPGKTETIIFSNAIPSDTFHFNFEPVEA